MSLATKLKALRIRKGKSLQEVADAIGASKTHVWDLETGRSDNPTVDLLTKLATYYNSPISNLLGENPHAPGEDPKVVALYRDLKQLSARDLETIKVVAEQLRRTSTPLTDGQLADAKRRRHNAKASLAIEGMHPTEEQEALFDTFEREKTSHESRRRILLERAHKKGAKGKNTNDVSG